MQQTAPKDFLDYASLFPERSQAALRKMRAAIKKTAPRAKERISYKVPAFTLDGKILVWFGAFKSHIGFYPGAAAIAAFKDRISAYKNAKGSVQFPLDEALPLSLIREMVEFRMRHLNDR